MPNTRLQRRLKAQQYYKENIERIKANKREYNKTPTGKMIKKIARWQELGIKYDDWHELYDNYMCATNCRDCGIEFEEWVKGGSNNHARVLDHDHETGEPRAFLCNNCNKAPQFKCKSIDLH